MDGVTMACSTAVSPAVMACRKIAASLIPVSPEGLGTGREGAWELDGNEFCFGGHVVSRGVLDYFVVVGKKGGNYF
jgi:hypothetical protein